MLFWRVVNPLARSIAGFAPWWVVLETKGRRSGVARRIPLARGPVDGEVVWLIAVHGERAAFVRNIASDPHVRLKIDRHWREGTASVTAFDPDVVRRFNLYAKLGPRTLGIEPKLLRVTFST
jgi:deazaflavin-dependent oxidoreductase (nitroreductase family)